ncbi:ComEC/Rec2 family competence protein [Dermacoccaceae bacterium W4C1]
MSPGDRSGMDLRLLLPAASAWTAVLATRGALPQWLLAAAGSAAGLAVVVLCLGHRKPIARVAALVLAATSLTLSAAGWAGLREDVGPLRELAQERAWVSLTGRLIQDPVTARTGLPGSDEPLMLARVSVHEVTGRGQRSVSGAVVLVLGDSRISQLRWRDEISLSGRLQSADRQDDVTAVLSGTRSVRLLQRAGWPLGGVAVVREALREATAVLPPDPAGLVPALVIGDTSAVPESLDSDMRDTGLTHLTAVSGANVTIVLMAIGWACGLLGVRRRARLPICLLGVMMFVLLCRPEPSVVRAATMGVVGLLAVHGGRSRSATAALGAAVVILLTVDPNLAASYGFALSVLATLGLVLFARDWGERIAARLPARLSFLGEAVAVPLAAQAACLPVLVLLQGEISLIGVPANMVAAVFVAPATLGALATVLVAPLSLDLGHLLAWTAGLPAWGIAGTARVGARVPGGTLAWPDGVPGAMAALLALVAAGVLGPWLIERRLRLLGAAVAVAVLTGAAVWPLPRPGWPPPGWVFVSCDVGQGDAGVLKTGTGRAILVDAGPDPDAVDRCLRDLGIGTLDLVVLTHLHADHVDGLAGALRGRTVGPILYPQVPQDAASGGGERQGGQALAEAVRRHPAGMRIVQAGQRISWASGSATVLWPQRVLAAGSVQNNASVVLDVRVAGISLILLGDVEAEGQAAVRRTLTTGDPRRTVVKVAHHGSGNHDPELLRRLAAPIGLISLGENSYGHPAPRLLRSLALSGTRVWRTDQAGDLAVVLKPSGSVVVAGSGR